MVFDSIAYKAVISNGLVLDKDGNKMSKRLGNAVNPFETIEQFGSDPVRWYMIANSSPWDNLKFDAEGVKEVSRKLFATLYNTYSFLALYANVDGFTGAETQVPFAERPEIDRWILSLLNTLIKDVEDALDDYEPTKAARAINTFVNDNLSNWYVRLNRKRFWGGEMNADKLSAYQTLYTCLKTVAQLMAPFAPFFADKLYHDLCTPAANAEVESVHLSLFPKADETMIDKALEHRMGIAQVISSMVLSLRRKVNIKVRQPLQTLMIPVNSTESRDEIAAIAPLILSEVNVKDIKFVSNSEGVLVKRIKADFKKLGPKYGKLMKAVAQAISEMSQDSIIELEQNGSIELTVADQKVAVELADVEIRNEDIPGWLVTNEGTVTVALDITVTNDLRLEGIARELVNRIQNIRKSRDYDITHRINIAIASSDLTNDAVKAYNDYICRQVLADSLVVVDSVKAADDEILDIDGTEVQLSITTV
jgi:isoleucyl-tRNA synthetase